MAAPLHMHPAGVADLSQGPFFVSSRRRHTRWTGDWSSDVCSSDLAYRNATFAPVILAAWQDRALDEERIAWVRDYHTAIEPYSEPGGYINFMDADDGARIRDNYRGHYDTLAEIKRSYDPGNLFRLNQNI